MQHQPILVTGTAGFIGYHIAQALLEKGYRVIGLDNLNTYYDVNLKKERLKRLAHPQYVHYECSITDGRSIAGILSQHQVGGVIHLAAQAGVRYSLDHPQEYIETNLTGFFHVIEEAFKARVKKFMYASSSSVYGLSTHETLREEHDAHHPISLYAATKRSNELLAHYYATRGMATLGVRPFTVYGPWGRPDMSLFKFTQKIINDEPIHVYNGGDMERSFTYIDDIVACIVRLFEEPSAWVAHTSGPLTGLNYRIVNVGNPHSTPLTEYIALIEKHVGKKAIIEKMGMQIGDVKRTKASTKELENYIGPMIFTTLDEGIKQFTDWFKEFYQPRTT